MRITKLDIKGFGKLEDCLFLPEPGLNVFFGANESGKSTLQSFIKAMLFGLKRGGRTKEGEINQTRKFRPWFGKAFAGLLEYELDNGCFYSVSRNFDKNTVSIFDGYSNNITGEFAADRDTGARFAEQHLGMSESVFERTAFIGQLQSTVNNEGRRIIAERLSNLKQSGDEQISYQTAVKALSKAQLIYIGSDRTTARPINILNTKIEQALQEEKEAKEQHNGSIELFMELEEARKEEQELNMRLEELIETQQRLIKNREYEDLCKKNRELCMCLEQIGNIEIKRTGLKKQKADVAGKLDRLKEYGSFSRKDADNMIEDNTRYQLLMKESKELAQKGIAINNRIVETEKSLERYDIFAREGTGIQEVLDNLPLNRRDYINSKGDRQEHTFKKQKIAASAGVCISGLLLLALYLNRSVVPVSLLPVFIAFGAAVFVIMSGILIASFIKGKRSMPQYRRKDKKLLEKWMDEIGVENIQELIHLKKVYDNNKSLLEGLYREKDTWLRETTDLNNRVKAVKVNISERLQKANIRWDFDFKEEDVTKWKKTFEEYISCASIPEVLKNELDLLEKQAEATLRHASAIYGEDIWTRDKLIKVIEELQHQISGEKAAVTDEPMNLEQVEESIDTVKKKLNQCMLRRNTFAARLENIPDGERLQKVHEKVETLVKEKEHLLLLATAIETAISVLNEAAISVQRDYIPNLNRVLSHYLSFITGGLYNDVKADDSLALKIMPEKHTERVLPEQLSSGTVDQIYFALRLGAVGMAENGQESIPIFLDEPFAQYDEERTKNALQLLIDESTRRQIFLFTCKLREVELINEMKGSAPVNIIYL